MLELIDRGGQRQGGPAGKLVYAYAHPIFWAPFSVIGDPGSATQPHN